MGRDAGMMGTELAGEDLTGKEGLAVKLTSAGIVLAGAGEFALGILAQGNVAGGVVAVARRLEWSAIYGATVEVGDALMVNAAGQLIPRTATNAVVGYALEAGALNEVHRITLNTQAVLA